MNHILLSVIYFLLAAFVGKLCDVIFSNSAFRYKYKLVWFSTLLLLSVGVIVLCLFGGNELLRRMGAEYW